MNNLLLALAGALILALAALFVGPYFVDWNSYRAVFEAQATRLAGRPVQVQGNVNLRLLPAPYVSFEQVEIAGDPTAQTPALLKVENYTLWLAVPPLLQGNIEAQSMEIDRPTLRVALKPDGTVNWQGLGRGEVDLPFVPRRVVLKDTNIRNGAIEIVDSNGSTLAKVTDVSGTFAARGLNGPFKFSGEVAGSAVRWSTGRFEETGALRIKGTLKNKDAGTSYAADGLLQKLTDQPVFTGAIAGKMRRKDSAGFEMQTDVYADTAGAQFREITLLLDAEGRPQVINGEGNAEWKSGEAPSAKIKLSSRWLDADRLIDGKGDKQELPERLDVLQEFLGKALPSTLHTTATFEATQVSLGGEALDNLALTVTRKGEVTELTSFSANMPGAAQLTLSGTLVPADPSRIATSSTFMGNVTARGRTASRFAEWLRPGWGGTVKQMDGPFSFQTDIESSSEKLVFENLRGQIDDTHFNGRLESGADDASPLLVEFSSDDVDLTRFFSNVRALGDTVRTWSEARSATDSVPSKAVSFKLAAGSVDVGRASFADVTVAANTRPDGSMELRQVAFTSTEGLHVDAERRGGTQVQTPLRYILRAPTSKAYEQLLELVGGGALDRAIDETNRTLLPANLAGRIAYDEAERTLNIRYDGTLAGNPAVGQVRIDGDDANWAARTWTVATDLSLTNPKALLEKYGLPTQDAEEQERAQPGRIAFYAIGQPSRGVKADFKLQSPQAEVSFAGQIESAEGGVNLDGTVAAVTRGRNLLSRLVKPTATSNDRLNFNARLTRKGNRTRFANMRLESDNLTASGEMEIVADGKNTTTTTTVSISEFDLPAALAVMTQTPEPVQASSGTIWPETPFDFDPLEGHQISATVSTRRVRLLDGIVAQDATFLLSGNRNRISLTGFKAGVGNGVVTADASLSRRPAGAEVKLTARGNALPLLALSGASTDENGDTPPAANGTAGFDLELSGIGLSPKGVISVMQGRGSVSMADGSLTYFSPQVVHDVAADVTEENAQTNPADMKARLSERLSDRALNIGATSIPFRIRDGAAQADSIKIDTPASTITATSFVDIARLRLDSEWRISPKVISGATALPPVTVFYAGDVRNVSRLTPGFGVAALERELTVRRLEGNIDQLEGLQSLRAKRREPSESEPSNRGRLRPTIGEEGPENRADLEPGPTPPSIRPAPPNPAQSKKRQRREADGLWNLDDDEPPVELQLQIPEGANPT